MTLRHTTNSVLRLAVGVAFGGTLGGTLTSCVRAPSPAPTPAAEHGAANGAAARNGAPGGPRDSTARPGGGSGGAQGAPAAPKPYAQVITKEAKTKVGMFKTHRVGTKLYFEIPRSELEKDMLLVGRYAQAAASNPRGQQAYAGDQFVERTLRWERVDNRILLRSPSYAITADSTLPVYSAVKNSNSPPILAILDIAAYGPDSSAVVDVTSLYTASPDFAGRGRPDEKRSYIETVLAFPDNVEVEATQTLAGGGGAPGAPGAGAAEAQTVVAHWSLVRLPEHPMMPRLADDRVGFFDLSQVDFGTDQFRSVEKSYIVRYRLEKKDPSAALSEPVKPIIYYIDPATPDKWKPYIKRGVEEWQAAFEQAGFKNAIIAMDPPKNDPNWSEEDIHHTLVRWLASTTENSVGPNVHDPRTGEILNGSVRIFHNILNLQRDWYFTQVAPLDPRVQKWPMPDSLMGSLLQFVVAHEVGHTLGLYHDHKGASLYPADSVRSKTWVAKMGHAPSIMGYTRFNYVAQPEDGIALADLVPRVGPYDKFAIQWGYTPIPGARTPEQERPTLDAMARIQDTVPWLRFGHASESYSENPDPGDVTEAVGSADPVKSTGYGLKNIKRIMPMLLTVTQKPTEDNSDLAEIYTRLIGQWANEMGHVVGVVGGSNVQVKYGNQPGPVYTPLSRERQAAAVKFLNDNVFTTPTFFIDPAITRRLEPQGSLTRINNAQSRVLGGLLDNGRAKRLIEYEALAPRGATAYTVTDLVNDLHHGIWGELGQSKVSIDVYRRNLQRTYIDQFGNKINPPAPAPAAPGQRGPMPGGGGAPGDLVAAMRVDLMTLRSQVTAAIPRAANAETKAHLIDAKQQLTDILEPKK